MTKVNLSSKKIADLPNKYVRLAVTEDKTSWHRLVEKTDGSLEYRMGAGKFKEMTPRQFITFTRSIVQAARIHQVEHLALELNAQTFPKLSQYGETWFISTLVENLTLAAYSYDTYKTSQKEKAKLKEILLCMTLSKNEQTAFKRGEVVASYMNQARDVANTPGDDMLPKDLAAAAKKLASGTGVKVTVLDDKAIKKEGLHALWAVGKGAEHLPRFIVMEYYGAGKSAKNSQDKSKQPIVLVGKGITYDTGGLNIKPSGYMHDMHMDMSGGSAVMAAICAAAKLKVKKNVIAIIPAAENAVSDRAMRAGDIIKSHSGKTIEVLHTDAEGRLVLADGLSYAKRYNPRVVLDAATLTGAALVALGQHASAIMTTNDGLQKTLMQLGEESGDYVWPLPLWDEYKDHIKSDRADVANIMPNFSKNGGAIEGGIFLSHFAPNCPWAHIDIAPRMEAIKSDKLAKGSTGEPVRLLVKFIETY